MNTTATILTDDGLRADVEIVLARLRAGEWQLWAEHTNGKAPRSWDKWSDPQDWDIPIPESADEVARIGSVSCGGGTTISKAVGAVEDAASRLMYTLRDGEYPETPDAAIDDLAITICTPNGDGVLDEDGENLR